MTDTTESPIAIPKLKTIVTLIITNAVVVFGVWDFFFYKMVELKNEQISILEKSEPQALVIVRKKYYAI